jgi:PII-like signaling protein
LWAAGDAPTTGKYLCRLDPIECQGVRLPSYDFVPEMGGIAGILWKSKIHAVVMLGKVSKGDAEITAKILRLSEDLPIVIEIVDSEDKIRGFLPDLETMMGSGLVTLEKVQVLQYGESSKLLT